MNKRIKITAELLLREGVVDLDPLYGAITEQDVYDAVCNWVSEHLEVRWSVHEVERRSHVRVDVSLANVRDHRWLPVA